MTFRTWLSGVKHTLDHPRVDCAFVASTLLEILRIIPWILAEEIMHVISCAPALLRTSALFLTGPGAGLIAHSMMQWLVCAWLRLRMQAMMWKRLAAIDGVACRAEFPLPALEVGVVSGTVGSLFMSVQHWADTYVWPLIQLPVVLRSSEHRVLTGLAAVVLFAPAWEAAYACAVVGLLAWGELSAKRMCAEFLGPVGSAVCILLSSAAMGMVLMVVIPVMSLIARQHLDPVAAASLITRDEDPLQPLWLHMLWILCALAGARIACTIALSSGWCTRKPMARLEQGDVLANISQAGFSYFSSQRSAASMCASVSGASTSGLSLGLSTTSRPEV